jgi:outer membrane protein assembly factor BamE (lipoprotein component of BamABCDE complex)
LAAETASVNAAAQLRMNKLPKISHLFVAASLLVALPACSPNVELRGNLPPPDQLAQVTVGKTTRDEALALLGTPSNVTPFGEEVWHYIWVRTESHVFFEPEEKERKVTTIAFDKAGIVRLLETKGLKDGKDVTAVSRETPTAGKEVTVLDQLIGNVGRFTKDAKPK